MSDQALNDVRWMDELLRDVIASELCVKWRCTTCGTREFRERLVRGVTLGALDAVSGKRLLTALRAASPPIAGVGDSSRADEAIRFALMLIWTEVPEIRDTLDSELDQSWAGSILGRMRLHDQKRRAARESQAKRASENALAKKARIAERAARKAKSDLERRPADRRSEKRK